MKKNILLFIILFHIYFKLFSQNNEKRIHPDISKYEELGLNLYDMGKYDSALIIYKKGLALSEKEKVENKQTDFLRYISNCLKVNGKIDSAIILTLKALEIDKKIEDILRTADDYYYLGRFYNNLPDITKSFEYFNLALKHYEIGKDTLGQVNCYGEMGYVYSVLKKHEKSIEVIKKSIDLANQVNGMYAPQLRGYQNIASGYAALNQPDMAFDFYSKALVLSKKHRIQDTSSIYCLIGETYISIKQPEKAIISFNTASEVMNKTTDFLYNNYQTEVAISFGLAQAYKLLNNNNKAEFFYKKALKKGESVNLIQYVIEINKELSELCYRIGKHKEAYEYYKSYNELSDKLINEEHIEALAKNEMKFLYEKKQLQQLMNQARKDLQTKAEIEKKSRIIYILSVVIFFFITISIIIYLIYRQNKLKGKQRELTIENKLMRAQMSPHFIFNSLNSIQKLVLENKNEAVLSYLNDFSSILRIMLENSFHNLVSLEKEITFINHYLSLEKLRFNNNFQFNIKIDQSVHEYVIKVPPMLIQPVIENSIKHGMASKNEGTINIHFGVDQKENNLLCSVMDNGIGRKKSTEIKQQNEFGHQSIATELIAERIKLYNYKRKKNLYSMTIIDIYDVNNNSIGTKVEYTFPLN